MGLYARTLAHAWRWTAGMPWRDRAAVDGYLAATNALTDSTDAERSGVKGGQLAFDEWTGDRIEENRLINQIRERIGRWRELGWPGVTSTTRQLLEYWTNPERERRL
ncbi:MAG: hypothetical protein HYX34_09895 [Actinobacteria bacterium]|nr:hypothetical protein [Actinomycetota bacterium]